MSERAIIELSGVHVTPVEEPATTVIRDVNWVIGRGEFWAVSGGPGSGRTSLLMTAAGLNRPGAGTTRFFGQDLSEASEADQVGWRRRIGFVFDGGGRLFSHLTVAENVALPLQYHLEVGEPAVLARVDELLAQTELQEYAHLTPSRLNFRLQQRAAFARTLAAEPEVLFLDNPLGGLSQREGRWWLDFLRQLRAPPAPSGRPATIVVTADDFRGWLDVADHFALIDDGRFRVVGGRERLMASGEAVVREFLTSVI
jgi:phospholipid/cholesterol/gamma-HCH transport system ATP-binding protein